MTKSLQKFKMLLQMKYMWITLNTSFRPVRYRLLLKTPYKSALILASDAFMTYPK